MWRRIHQGWGLVCLVGFLLTGQYLRRHAPPMADLDPQVRLLLRSRHLYILLAALINLAIGAYFQSAVPGWRRILQCVGSLLLVAGPVAMAIAFFAEADRGNPLGKMALVGASLLLAGTLAHVVTATPALILRDPASSWKQASVCDPTRDDNRCP